MAIFDFVPGIEVTVCVDGQPLPEFDDDDDSAKLAQAHSPQSLEEYCAKRTVSRYVQSIDDKDFTVRCEIRPPYQMDCPGLAIFLEVDHRHIDGRWIMKNGANSVEMKGLTTGARGTEVFQPIKFTKIKLATGKDMDSSQIKKDSELMSKVGTIVIEIFRAEVDASKAPRTGNGKLGIDASGEVDEKSLKGDAKSHRAGFGRPKPAPPSRTTEPKYLDGPDYPLAIFKFKYRSEEALKQLYIIKRTPEPSRSPSVVDGNHTSDDELTEEQKRAVEEFAKSLKKRSSSGHIKRENKADDSGGSRKKRKSGEKITIDLTADTDTEDDEIVALD